MTDTSETLAQRAAQSLVDLNEAILEGSGDLAVECAAVITALAADLAARVEAAYKEGWNDREGDFLSGAARIGIDDAAIKAAREDGMEAAVKIAQADERTYQGYDGCNPALIVPRIIAAIRAAKDQPA